MRLEAAILTVLLTLIALEMVLKWGEVTAHPRVMILGIILGFSMGFKLSAMHQGHVSKKAITFAEDHKKELAQHKTSSTDNILRQQKDLERKDKLIASLKEALRERDSEVKHLVSELQKLKKT